MQLKSKYLPIDQVLLKLQSWCAYQERSHFELDKKLAEFELTMDEKLEIVSSLITQNFINEERFAQTFTRGKFNIKKWGKVKIKAHLKMHKIPLKLINVAIAGIPDEDYLLTIEQLIKIKSKTVKGPNHLVKKQKVINYLISKGFEFDLIMDVYKLIEDENKI
ncbi:MAG: regulatory protein RecX [Bacteroidota bacterium]|nr:RecX family transcriptional regulator [Bacteroidota bacterium]MCA6443672.1 RecX family transcriptional regulator [Bacteroidota bacterium]